jgi:PhnB protein
MAPHALRTNSDKEADRIYALLSAKGQVFMKMEETFFASRFAMLRFFVPMIPQSSESR